MSALPLSPVLVLLGLPVALVVGVLLAKLAEHVAFLRLGRELGLRPGGSILFRSRQLAGTVRGVRLIVTEGTEVDHVLGEATHAWSRRVVDVVALLPPDLDVRPDDRPSDVIALLGDGVEPLASRVRSLLPGRELHVELGRLRIRVGTGVLPGWGGVREAVAEAVAAVEALDDRRRLAGPGRLV